MSARRTQPVATWLVGSLESCEIVVKDPTVSARHCRLSHYPDGHFEIEGLGSTNGTYVNGQPLIAHNAVDVSAEQRITLGPNATFAWPAQSSVQPTPQIFADTAPGTRVISVGRAQECDVLLDYPVVSREHAGIIESAGHYAIEDLHSTNGTALNQLHNRISTRVTVRPEMLLTGLNSAPTPEWCGRFAKSEYHKQFIVDRAGKIPEGASQARPSTIRRFSTKQWVQLVHRNLILKFRDRA